MRGVWRGMPRIPAASISDDAETVEKSPDSVLNCTVEVTELMGAEIYLYLSFEGREDVIEEGKNVIARVSARSLSRAGDNIKVAFDMSRVHLFDKDTEKCICH